MSMRIPLTKTLTAGQASPSIQIRLDEHPFLFVFPLKGTNGVTCTGTVDIEHSIDTMPDPQGEHTDNGVTDANAQWIKIITGLAPGDQVDWRNPLKRIRVNGTNLGSGIATVTMLCETRSLKGHKTNKRGMSR